MERKKQNFKIEVNPNNHANINNKIFNNMKNKKKALEQLNSNENAKVNNKPRNNKANNLNVKNNKTVNYRPNHEHTQNNNKLYNSTFYNSKLENYSKNTINKDTNKINNKYVIDYNESIKKARNSSAPSLKQKINDDQDIIKNNRYRDNSRNKKDNFNPFLNNKIIIQKRDKKGKHNMSYENHKQLNEKEKPSIKNKIYDISQRINNIKQSYNSKPNKKYFQNNLNKFNSNKKSHIYANNKDNISNKTRNKQKKSLKNKEDNLDINLNIFKDILEKQEKIIMMKKKLKNEKEKTTSRNRGDLYGFNSYNKSFQNNPTSNKNKKNHHNKSYDNSLNNNLIHKEINDKSSEINDEKEIEIDNEEKVLDIKEDNLNINDENYEKNKFNRTFENNLVMNKESKKEKNENNSEEGNKEGKISNTIEIDSMNEKNLVNTNLNLYNKNRANKNKEKNNKKEKKIRIMNVPKYNDYYFTKSSNIFHYINNNNLNKTLFEKNNKSKIADNNINKSKFNESYEIKKSNINAKRKKVKTDLYNNTNINTNINNKNIQKNKENKKRPINSSKIKKHNVKIKIQQPKIRENKSDNNLIIKQVEQIGCICRPGEISYGKEKINQDNYFNYNMNIDDLIYIGVCDGHGDYGHFISDYLIKHLPKNFNNSYNDLKKNLDEKHPQIPMEKIQKIFENSFSKTDSDLNNLCDYLNKLSTSGEIPIEDIFNCEYSGSTCVSLLLPNKNSKEAYIANVGDSRAIIIKEEKPSKGDKWTFKQLSRDHKPTEEDEFKRIIDADGEIEAIEDDDGNWTGPLRVWEKGSEGPGLAMTRSLGDKVGKKIGVCCTPEVTKYDIKEEDKVFVLASDGLWEYMDNQEVTDLVKNIFEDMKKKGEIDGDKMAKILYEKAVNRWREKDVGMDDITIICIILN